MATQSKSGSGKAASAQDDKLEPGIETAPDGTAYPTTQAPPPEQGTVDKVTYRDPRPLDWPQKADRSVYIGVVHTADADDDGTEKKGYVYAGQVREDEELEVGGTEVKDAQVVAGGGHLNLIINGQAFNLSSLGGGIQADLSKGLEMNANS